MMFRVTLRQMLLLLLPWIKSSMAQDNHCFPSEGNTFTSSCSKFCTADDSPIEGCVWYDVDQDTQCFDSSYGECQLPFNGSACTLQCVQGILDTETRTFHVTLEELPFRHFAHVQIPSMIKHFFINGYSPIQFDRMRKGNYKPFSYDDGFISENTQLDKVVLTDINLRDFKYESLPKNLLYLSLRNANLLEIPSDIARMTRLNKLLLDNNNIIAMPKSPLDSGEPNIFEGLKTIRYLSLANNNLSSFELPFPLKNLEILDLHGNKLTSIPREIFRMNHLQELRLFDNPIRNVHLTRSDFEFITKIKGSYLTDFGPVTNCPDDVATVEHWGKATICVHSDGLMGTSVIRSSRGRGSPEADTKGVWNDDFSPADINNNNAKTNHPTWFVIFCIVGIVLCGVILTWFTMHHSRPFPMDAFSEGRTKQNPHDTYIAFKEA